MKKKKKRKLINISQSSLRSLPSCAHVEPMNHVTLQPLQSFDRCSILTMSIMDNDYYCLHAAAVRDQGPHAASFSRQQHSWNSRDGKNLLFYSICSNEYVACVFFKFKNAHLNTLHLTCCMNTLLRNVIKIGRSINFIKVETGNFEHFQLCLSAIAKVKIMTERCYRY